jgi:hypothetical protein
MKILTPEQFETKLRELMALADERGEHAGRVAREAANAEAVYLEDAPDVNEWVEAALRRSLEDEIVIAEPVGAEAAPGEDFIQLGERELEVAKRALARLKLPQLSRVAVSVGLDPRGSHGDLVDRIARSYYDDPAEVARLILTHEEARAERGLIDRLYPLRIGIDDLANAASTLQRLSGRYIRVGVARWFVYADCQTQSDGLWINGFFRSYDADAKREGDAFELVSVPSDAVVSARLRGNQDFLEVRGRGETESRAILTAVEWATSLRRSPGLQLRVEGIDGDLMRWDQRSIFMLYFLDRVLPDSGIDILNLTSARFESAVEPGFARRPTVRSVALQGQHLLSSKAACELLMEGRALVELSLDLRFRPQPEVEWIFPVRFSLARDHATVLTGFGSNLPESAAVLHRDLSRRLRQSLIAGAHVDTRLQALARRVIERARSSEPVAEADIFAPPADWLRRLDDLEAEEGA